MTSKSDAFIQRIQNIELQVGEYIAEKGNERLKSLWPEWIECLNRLKSQSHERSEVEISLVGGTGAGKSTLLNAIIGARVLPVSNMRACTAAISEVAYADGPYRGRVEFISRESWSREVDLLRADYRDAQLPADSEDASPGSQTISRSALDKLRAVYRREDDTEDFNPLHLVEPREITHALDVGLTQIEHSNIDDFRRAISQFLDSSHRYWPIVKSVSVQGPFPSLSDGAKLVDLPGLNDPNEAREAVTQNYLKTCRFVWIVFNIKRALTKDMIDLMQSDDFLRQIVMDGRADALTFVGTASDDVDTESGIEEFGLHEDATAAEVIEARNRAVRKVVLDQLDELAERLAILARESPAAGERLGAKLKNSKILTVSAREFLRLEGLARTNSAGLDDVAVTEIPALRQHMREISESYGINAHMASLDRHLTALISEIEREAQGQRIALRNQAEVSERQRKEIEAAIQAARGFLDRDLEESQARLVQDLEASQSLLAERIRRAIDRAHLELEETFKLWARIHHSTIKAVCRRGGIHDGAAGRNDFPSDLCKPIFNGIAFAWSDFFGDKLRQTMEKWTDRLRHNADAHYRKLLDSLGSTARLPEGTVESMSNILDTTDRILNEILGQTTSEMDRKITRTQRTLYEGVPEQVQANMRQVFIQAADESGDGMKKRMVQILSRRAREVSKVMFDDAGTALLDGVRSLNNWLGTEYGKMAEAVKRNAVLASENFVTGGSDDANEVRETELMLSRLGQLLQEQKSNPSEPASTES